jgi:hypothetical protein
VCASRAFIDYLMVQIFNFLGGTSGSIPVASIGGDGDAAHFLNGVGVFATPSYPVGANPTASVGTAAVNGAATTFMRSDAAPAISLSIAPTWTAVHTFSAGVVTTTLSMSGALTGATTGNFSGALTGGSVVATGGFGCNGKTAQIAATVSAAVAGTAGAAYTATEQGMINDLKTLSNQMRTALVNDGIAV